MHEIGNILPDARQLASADRFADAQLAAAVSQADRELAACTRREVRGRNGELVAVRYYRTPTQYTEVTGWRRPGAPRKWFETRTDGHDWPLKA